MQRHVKACYDFLDDINEGDASDGAAVAYGLTLVALAISDLANAYRYRNRDKAQQEASHD